MYELNAFVEGNLGKMAEISQTATGKIITKMSVAVNNANGSTTWVDVALWGQELADKFGAVLVKGAHIKASGRPQADSWLGEDGKVRSRLAINVNAAKYLTIVEHENRGHFAPVSEPVAEEEVTF